MQRCPLTVSSQPQRSTYTFIITYCTRRTSSFNAHTSSYRSRFQRQLLPRPVVTPTRRQQASSTSQFRRSDFHGQGFTGIYEPGQPTGGPLGAASIYGVPKITPRALKDHLDQFVVGQERAKKVLSTAVYNHYQRIQEIQRRDDEVVEYYRRQDLRHPVEGMAEHQLLKTSAKTVEDEYPGQQSTTTIDILSPSFQSSSIASPILDKTPLIIEKSNVLLLGPSGVGKTLMTKTLAHILDVPFSMSDVNSFTQAGYIGEDAEVCVQRLLAAADYDVSRAERGIIVLDEIDKIATAKVSQGKDVSGEGVQQALLKIIEGTTVQVQAKQERGRPVGTVTGSDSNMSSSNGGGGGRQPNAVPTGSFGSRPPGKGETYNVNTDQILFICSGAFLSLHKTIRERISKGSIGFGAAVRAAPGKDGSDGNDPTIRVGNKADDELFRKHLPFYSPPTPPRAAQDRALASPSPDTSATDDYADLDDAPAHNTLDLTTPSDLHRYGLITELVGRLPIISSLSPLSLSALVRVLTEPRNALLSQYTALFALSAIELRLSTAALWEVARQAKAMGTGARGLRTVMEGVLMESMFEGPGSGIRYVFVGAKAAKREAAVGSWGREGRAEWHGCWEREEEEWARKRGRGGKQDAEKQEQQQQDTFETYRERDRMSGAG